MSCGAQGGGAEAVEGGLIGISATAVATTDKDASTDDAMEW